MVIQAHTDSQITTHLLFLGWQFTNQCGLAIFLLLQISLAMLMGRKVRILVVSWRYCYFLCAQLFVHFDVLIIFEAVMRWHECQLPKFCLSSHEHISVDSLSI